MSTYVESCGGVRIVNCCMEGGELIPQEETVFGEGFIRYRNNGRAIFFISGAQPLSQNIRLPKLSRHRWNIGSEEYVLFTKDQQKDVALLVATQGSEKRDIWLWIFDEWKDSAFAKLHEKFGPHLPTDTHILEL